MIEVMVNGCNGKMGQIVCNLIDKDENLFLKCGFDKFVTGEFAFPVFNNIKDIPEKPDVIIDFSVPIATLNILEYAVQNKIPVVIATTGFSTEEEKIICAGYKDRKLEKTKKFARQKELNQHISLHLPWDKN